MKTIYDTLQEGLLDDNFDQELDQKMIADWLKENCKGAFKTMTLKSGELKVWGKLVISTKNNIPNLNISFLDGDLYIENCPDITDLNGIFNDTGYATVKGSIYITNCPKLISVAALPDFINGWLKITDCKSFRDIDHLPKFVEGLSIIKCAKRFKKEQLASKVNTVSINCSAEDEIANITEAVRDPNLARMWEQVQNRHLNKDMAVSMEKMLNRWNINKITPSDCKTISVDQKNFNKCKSELRSFIKYSGFVLAEDWDGEFKYVVTSYWGNKQVWWLMNEKPEGFYWWRNPQGYQGVNDFLNWVADYAIKYNIQYLHFYNVASEKDDEQRAQQSERRRAKDGAIAMYDKYQLETMLRNQKERYKKAVQQIRAARASDKYLKTAEKVEAIMQRFNKLITKMVKDPKWADSCSYKLDYAIEAIRKGYVQNSSSQQYGVIYAFQNWASAVVKASIGDSSYSPDRYLKTLEEAIERADNRLSAIGL